MKAEKVGLFAYGEMASSAFRSLSQQFQIPWIITPPHEATVVDEALPVEVLAHINHTEVVRTNSEKEIIQLLQRSPTDAVVIASYNKILSKQVLGLSRFINVHHGDLPRFRGRANINWAIILDKKSVGLTIHQAIPELDAGNIYAQYQLPILDEDTIKTMYDKVNTILEQDLAEVVTKVLTGSTGKPQEGQATYCCTRLPEDGYIDWSASSRQIYNLVRALTHPYPGAFTFYRGEKLMVWTSEVPQQPRLYEGRIPGRIARIHKGLGVEVLTGDASIIIKDVSLGGKAMNAAELIKSIKASLGLNIAEVYERLMQAGR